MLIAAIILSTVLCVTFLFTTINLLSKNEALESYIETYTSDTEKRLDEQRVRATILLQSLQKLDAKQMFEKDDEVGTLFEQIKIIIENYVETQQEEE